MKASFTVLVVTLFLTEGFSQSKDVFFEIPNGKIKFYLNYTGDVTLKSRAYFYRLTQFEANRFSYQDSLSDFYKNGTLAFKQHFKDGLFDGEQIQYYKDGSIHHKGEFRANQKSGRWIYYYDNGQVEKEIEYVGKTPRLINNFSKKGKVYVKDGNGKFRGTVVVGYKSFNEFKLKGKVKDGYKDGWWTYYGGKELYENGRFVKGYSTGMMYDNQPVLTLEGCNKHEEATIFKFIAIPKTNNRRFLFKDILAYNGSNNLNVNFKAEFMLGVHSINRELKSSNYWCFLQFEVTKLGEVTNLQAYSNNAHIPEKIKLLFSKLDKFQAVRSKEESVPCYVYLSFHVDNGNIILPNYSFNSDINVMELVPQK